MQKLQNFIKTHLFQAFIFGSTLLFTLLNGASDAKSHVLAGLLLVGLLVFWFVDRRYLSNVSTSAKPWSTLAVSGIFLSVLISYYFSQTPTIGLNEVIATGFGISVFFAATYAFSKKQNREFYLLLLVWLTILGSLAGILLYILGPYDRFTGFIVNLGSIAESYPNVWADFVLLTVPFCLVAFYRAQKVKSRWITGSSLVLGISTLLLTFSRGGWYAALATLAIGSIIYHFWGARKLNKAFLKRVLLVGLIAIILTGVINTSRYLTGQKTNSFLAKFIFQSDEQAESVTERRELFTGAIELFKQEPIVGYGPQSYRHTYPGVQDKLIAYAQHPHNIFLKLAAEQGIVGLLPFLFLLFLTAIVTIQKVRKNNAYTQMIFAAALANVGLLGHQLLEYNLGFLLLSFLMWLNFGLIFSEIPKPNHKQKPVLLPAILSLIIIIGLAVSLHEGYYGLSLKQARSTPTSAAFQQASKLIQPQDTTILQLEALIAEGDSKQAIEIATANEAVHQHIAEFYYLWGQALTTTDTTAAHEKYAQALNLDRYNQLEYYIGWYETMPTTEQPEAAKKISQLLNEYLPLLERNAQFTAISENPEAAIKLAQYIDSNSLATNIEQITKVEREKLNQRYQTNF